MRTLERWFKFLFLRTVQQHFSPRLQNDLVNLPWPESINGEVESCFIYGPTHYGKTVYAAFLLLQENKNQYLNLNTDPKVYCFVSVPELFHTIRESFDQKETSSTEYLNKIRTCDLLVLDDIGVRDLNDWGMEILYLVLNYRYEQMKKTIITSNLNLQELSNLFGDDRIVSRIQRMCKIIEKSNWRK